MAPIRPPSSIPCGNRSRMRRRSGTNAVNGRRTGSPSCLMYRAVPALTRAAPGTRRRRLTLPLRDGKEILAEITAPTDQWMHAEPAWGVLNDVGLPDLLPVGSAIAARAPHRRPQF